MSGATDGDRRVVEAAGAVVWRPGAYDRVEVLLVHRPRYDDWSFPKGKLHRGEHATAAATREVFEETGVRIHLGPPLPTVRYPLRGGADKRVRYWSAVPDPTVSGSTGAATDAAGATVRGADVAGSTPPAADSASFVPNAEVDERGWYGLREAARRLTHPRDRALLSALPPVPTQPFALLRHAEAVRRDQWSRADDDRPLSDAGTVQAERLVAVLAAYGITRIVSSPSVRCVHTVLPYALRHLHDIDRDPVFREETETAAVHERVRQLLAETAPTVVCSHRPTLPAVFEALGLAPVELAPAGLVVSHVADRRAAAVEHWYGQPA